MRKSKNEKYVLIQSHISGTGVRTQWEQCFEWCPETNEMMKITNIATCCDSSRDYTLAICVKSPSGRYTHGYSINTYGRQEIDPAKYRNYFDKIETPEQLSKICSKILRAEEKKKRDFLKQYAGKTFYAKVSRMGGKFVDIHALAVYGINDRGAPHKIEERLNCVANIAQYEYMSELTKHCGYIVGRPTVDNVYRELQVNNKLFD